MIKSVIFDLDGTLLDRDESVKQFIACQYERLSTYLGHIPKEKYVTRFIELDQRGYVWKDKVYQQIVEEYKICGISWEALLRDYKNKFKNHCVPFPNLIEMLEALQKQYISLGMITNGYGQFQMDNIEALCITSYFDSILISEWEGIKKPNPEIFKRALHKLNVLPNESIFVGDHPENDVYAAQKVGMKGVWKKDLQWNDVEADFIVTNLIEVPSLIEQINLKS
ncbi:HAD family hydrolase [Bacillus alkalicellulosilyticus]|uniref:HAD family hydrolase n=1 Tax=Alkalihalobacterium alkalicellulosilyticum TaxID=1912214 RepID=UPI000997EC86|nr:HAD family hydrolase [Bacillus alkalicellulosilyticus]